MATFDRNQIKEFICKVDEDRAYFVGANFAAARLIGYIESQRSSGALSDDQATQLLDDAKLMMQLIDIGRMYNKIARDPSPEIETMVLARHQKELASERTR